MLPPVKTCFTLQYTEIKYEFCMNADYWKSWPIFPFTHFTGDIWEGRVFMKIEIWRLKTFPSVTNPAKRFNFKVNTGNVFWGSDWKVMSASQPGWMTCLECKALKKPAEQNQRSTLPMKILHSRTFWRWSKASFDKKKSSAEPNGNSHSQNFSWDLGSFFLARSGDIIFNFSIMSRNMRLKDWKLKRLLSHWALLLLTQASELNLAVWCYTLECATS